MPGYSRGSGAIPSAVVTGICSLDGRTRSLVSVRSAFLLGQDSPRAALIYQHTSRQVDQAIADKLSALIEGIGSTVKV
jgi:hypothetical protein